MGVVNVLKVFYDVMVEFGVLDKVIVFMVFDFGCILFVNIDGLDYGWGLMYFVLGGVVNGW